MEENARKRKREEDGDQSEMDGIVTEKPKEGLKESNRKTKKQKKENRTQVKSAPSINMTGENSGYQPQADTDAPEKTKADKRREKKARQKVKEEAKVAKSQAKNARKEQEAALLEDSKVDLQLRIDSEEENDEEAPESDIDHINISGMSEVGQAPSVSTATPSPPLQSPAFDILNGLSGTSSISSIAAPTTTSEGVAADGVANESKKPKADPEELKARLQHRIEALRAARNADGLNGNPARNRQELMEARRRKEEQRRAHKKELRNKAKEEEQSQRDLALSRGSPLLSPTSGSNAISSPLRESEPTNHFSFGRVAFEDGQRMDAGLSAIIDPKKRKGPQDPLTAIKAAANKQARIDGLDEAKRSDIEEKELWLNARKRAQGERVRDDTSLLKKTLKRKDKAKKKSGKEWNERIEGVQKGQAIRQKKREGNIQKRKEEKGMKGKKKGAKGGAKKAKPKGRPGFEGSFRAKVAGGGKKK